MLMTKPRKFLSFIPSVRKKVRGSGLASFEIDGNDDGDGKKLVRRHSFAVTRERRRNSAGNAASPSPTMRLARFLSHDGSNAPSSTVDEWKSCRSVKLGKGSEIGRVKVFVRIRPVPEDKGGKEASLPFQCVKEEAEISLFPDEKSSEKTYKFDHIFTQEEDNQQVCNTLTEPLIQSAMNGFNGTMMAYGQTSSGKTYTLMSESGITQSLVDKCFTRIQGNPKHNFKVTISYLQIYQEKIYDLLKEGSENIELTIRENPQHGIYVENLTEYVVRSPTEVHRYISKGQSSLMISETKMNQCSSRSHAVLQMTIEQTSKDNLAATQDEDDDEGEDLNGSKDKISKYLDSFGKDVIIRGKIHICDLAGSERIKRAGDDRLLETQAINSSLLELGNVIQALADEKAIHVPYRNSILTRLLQESLGGNCKTGLIICISPSAQDFQETKCSLNFGQRARKVRNKAYINMEVDYKKLSEHLMKQIDMKESEMRQLLLAKEIGCKKDNTDLQKKLVESKRETESSIKLQNELHVKELEALQEEIFVLNEQVCTHKEQIADCESSMGVTTDVLTSLRTIVLEFMKTEKSINLLFDKISSTQATNEQFSLLKSFHKPLLMNCQSLKANPDQDISDTLLIEYLSLLREEVDSIQVGTLCNDEMDVGNVIEMKISLDKVKKDLDDENMMKLDGIEEDKTSDSGIEEDKLTDTEINRLRYKLALKSFVYMTSASLELLQLRLNGNRFKEEAERLSCDFHGYKSSKDLLFNELSRARKEERDSLSQENEDLRSKVEELEKKLTTKLNSNEQTVGDNDNNVNNDDLNDNEEDLVDRITQLEDENKSLVDQYQSYKLTTELSLNQMEKSRRAEKDDLSKEMNEEISRLQRENNELLSRIREYTTTIKEQGCEIVSLNHACTTMDTEMREIKQKADDDLDSVNGDLKTRSADSSVNGSRTDLDVAEKMNRKDNEINFLKVQITGMEAEIEVLQSKVLILENNEEDKMDQIVKLQHEILTAPSNVEKDNEIKELNTKVENMVDEIEQLQDKMEEYEQQMNEKKGEIARLNQAHVDSLNEAGECITNLSNEKENVVKELNEKMMHIEKEVAELQGKISTLEKKVEEKKIEITKIQREHRKALTRVATSTSTIEQENEIKNLNVAVAKSEVENEQLRSKIKVFERKVVDKENEVLRLQNKLNDGMKATRDTVVSEFESTLANKANEIKELTIKITKMEVKNKEFLAKIKSLNQREEERKHEMTKIQSKHDECMRKISEYESNTQEKEDELKVINLKIVEMEDDAKDMQTKLTLFKETEDGTKDEILQLKSDYEESIKSVDDYSSKMKDKQNEIENMTLHIEELQDESDELMNKLALSEKNEEEHRKEIERLKKDHDESLLQIRECSSTVKERKAEMELMDEKIQNMQVENERLNTKVKTLEEEEIERKSIVDKVQKEKSEFEEEMQKHVDESNEREVEMLQMKKKAMQFSIDNEDLKSRIKELEKREDTNNMRFAMLQKEHEDSFTVTLNKLDNERKTLSSKVTKIGAENENLKSKLELLEKRYDEKKKDMKVQYEKQEDEIRNRLNRQIEEKKKENKELLSKVTFFQNVIEEDKKKEKEQTEKISEIENKHHTLVSELEESKTRLKEKEKQCKKINPELAEVKAENGDLYVKIEAYKQIIEQKENEIKEMEGMISSMKYHECSAGHKKGADALYTENARLMSQMVTYKNANDEVHEEIAKLSLENSNLLSQFDCFLSAVNKKERLCKKLAAKVCDLEAINEKLFDTISQSINEEDDTADFYMEERKGEGLRIKFGSRGCSEGMKDVLADTIIEQEERLVAEITTENVYDSTLQRSERISINTSTFNVSSSSKRGQQSDKNLMSSVYNTLKSAEKAQLDIKEKLSEVECEKSELGNKCKQLESSIEKLRNEKMEFHTLILELTQNSSKDDFERILDKEKQKVDSGCQTDDVITPPSSHVVKTKHHLSNKSTKRGLKVAHIKPLVSFETDTESSVMDCREVAEYMKDEEESSNREDYNITRDEAYSQRGSGGSAHRQQRNGYTEQHSRDRKINDELPSNESRRQYVTTDKRQAPPRYCTTPNRDEQNRRSKRNSPNTSKEYEICRSNSGTPSKSSKSHSTTSAATSPRRYHEDNTIEIRKSKSPPRLLTPTKDYEVTGLSVREKHNLSQESMKNNGYHQKNEGYHQKNEGYHHHHHKTPELPPRHVRICGEETVTILKSSRTVAPSKDEYNKSYITARDAPKPIINTNSGWAAGSYLHENQTSPGTLTAKSQNHSASYLTDASKEYEIYYGTKCDKRSHQKPTTTTTSSTTYTKYCDTDGNAMTSQSRYNGEHVSTTTTNPKAYRDDYYTSSVCRDTKSKSFNTDTLSKYTREKINESPKLRLSNEWKDGIENPNISTCSNFSNLGNSNNNKNYNNVVENSTPPEIKRHQKMSPDKLATRYGIDIDLSTQDSQSGYAHTTHYETIKHKYNKFQLPY